MTDEKTEPVCRWCQEPAERHLGRLKVCTNGGALSFTPAEPEANATIVGLRAKVAYWKEHSGAHQERAEGWKNAEEIAIRDRDAAIERAEKAEADTREFGGNAEALSRRQELDIVTAERDALQANAEVKDDWIASLRSELSARDPRDPLLRVERHAGLWIVVLKRDSSTLETAGPFNTIEDAVLYSQRVRALDAAKPAEPTPAQCSGKCKWDDGAGEGPGYFYGDADCPVHGVERARHRATFVEWNCGALGMQMYSMDPERVAAEIASWDAEPTPLPAERCHCIQHSMERPDIHSINWYWSKHTREACTLELPNVRCWCGRLRSEHIDGHAAPVTPPAVDPRDVRIAELEEKLVAADVYGVELARRIGERDAKISGLASERIHLLDQRDQQRARADAAEARCEAGLPLLFTGAKERSK